MKKIIIFASGSGTNAERITTYFQEKGNAEVTLIITNNPQAGVLSRAKRLGVPTLVADRNTLYHSEIVLSLMKQLQPDLIVLAGFLWKFPTPIIEAFPNRIINIHPALLPKYGGKGLYGHFVHEAVIAHGESESGITIHYVNEHYDQGTIIYQAKTEVERSDNAERLAEKIHSLEYRHFPEVIERLLFP